MNKRIKIIVILTVVLLCLIYFLNLNINTTIYISSQRKNLKQENVNLYLDNRLIESIDLKKYYDLNLYSNKVDLSLGNHIIELRNTDGKIIFSKKFTYYGINNFIIIGYFDENKASFEQIFSKPKLL